MLRSSRCALSWGLSLACLAGCAEPTGSRTSSDAALAGHVIQITTEEDFQRGELSGLSVTAAGDLRVDPSQPLFDTPYLWVPGETARTISQIDSQTLRVLGTYTLKSESGVDCYFPGSATVDREGNVWVACRGEAALNRDEVKPTDVPKTVGNRVLKLSKQRGTVLLSVEVGYGPRGLALDERNHLWVTCAIDDLVWEIDGETGQCYRGDAAGCGQQALAVGDFPTAAAVDQRGHLWVLNHGLDDRPSTLTELDTLTGELIASYGPYSRGDSCQELVSLALDAANDVWLGGGTCGDLLHVQGTGGSSGVAGGLVGAYPVGTAETDGIALDRDGHAWVAQGNATTVTKLDVTSGTILATTNVGQQPTGVALDGAGNLWVVDPLGMSVHRQSILAGVAPTEISLGATPASFGDMLGTALRQITLRGRTYASWRGKLDAGSTEKRWQQVAWEADVPLGSNLLVRSRCAATEQDLPAATWSAFTDKAPSAITCSGQNQPWLELEVRFTAGPGPSPLLHALSASYAED